MDAGRSANFHALIGSLYDAALDPREWQAIPVRLARFFEAGSSTLWLWPKRAGALEGLETFGWTKQELDTYRDHYAERDIWSIEGVKQPMRSALLMSEVVPSAVFAESEFYRDLGRHLGLFYCMGTALSVDDRQLCILGLHRPRERPDFTGSDQRLLAVLIPHLERALQLRNRVEGIRQEGRIGFAALNALAVAVVIVDASGGILHANPAAEALAAERDGILLQAKRVVVTSSAAACELRRLIRGSAAVSGGGPGHSGGSLSVPRRSGRRPLNVLVTPLPAARMGDALQRPCAALFILDPESPSGLQGEALSHLFGLSAAEARVLIELGSGLSIEQIADTHRVSRSTVRTQLQRVFEKTGTRRQAEAVALVCRLGLVR
jgi:DNA-binding CsgD family transcriptional regulator/PAS domain-containing protein